MQFVAPELILRALMANEKLIASAFASWSGFSSIFFANQFIDAKDSGAKRVRVDAGDDGNVRVTPAPETPPK